MAIVGQLSQPRITLSSPLLRFAGLRPAIIAEADPEKAKRGKPSQHLKFYIQYLEVQGLLDTERRMLCGTTIEINVKTMFTCTSRRDSVATLSLESHVHVDVTIIIKYKRYGVDLAV